MTSTLSTPFTAFMLLMMQPVQPLPLRGDNSSNATVFIQINADYNQTDDDLTATFTEQRDLVDPVDSDSLEFDAFSVKHISALQSLFETGSHLFDPFVHFIQSLADGVKGSSRAPLAVTPAPRDKRMLYIV